MHSNQHDGHKGRQVGDTNSTWRIAWRMRFTSSRASAWLRSMHRRFTRVRPGSVSVRWGKATMCGTIVAFCRRPLWPVARAGPGKTTSSCFCRSADVSTLPSVCNTRGYSLSLSSLLDFLLFELRSSHVAAYIMIQCQLQVLIEYAQGRN